MNFNKSNDFIFDKNDNWKENFEKLKNNIHLILLINMINISFFNFLKWKKTNICEIINYHVFE